MRHCSALLGKLFILSLFVAVSLWGGSQAFANTGVPQGGVLNYWVVRDGSPIGTHIVKFSAKGNDLSVDILTDVQVKVAFITVYKFKHEGHEKWQGGQMVSMQSTTDDDGTPHDLVIVRKDGKFKATDKGTVREASAELLPASLWHPGIVGAEQAAVINTLDGTKMAISTAYKGDEDVKGVKGQVKAKHYVVSGELERELWFDPDGVLVKVRFKGKDGSDIQYVLR